MTEEEPQLTMRDPSDVTLDEHPTADCPACDTEAPRLARLGIDFRYPCWNPDCRVSEFYEHEQPWRGHEGFVGESND